MAVKLTVLVVLVALGMILDFTEADFFYNHPAPKKEELAMLNLKCVPGRTVIKVEEKAIEIKPEPDTTSDEFSRRTYSDADADERCFICICSTEGKDEYCSKRDAGTLNECMIISAAMKEREMGVPFNIEKSLPYRVRRRRDLIWHNDEIPYDPKSRCYRGHSYYTNHDKPNDTNIYDDEDEQSKSQLDYSSEGSCYYCVCSVDGSDAGCISRSIWFCNYLRYIRSDNAARDMYAHHFEQDRPTYFRQLSWRMRRTMDDNLFNFIDYGGDTLCCSHPDGHRRQLHNVVHNKLRTLKKRIPKENLLGGAMRGDYVDFIVNND